MSTINVNNLSGKGGATPNLPDGAVISGVATVTNLKPTNVNVSGAVTATTFDGSLKSTGTPTLGLGVTINSSGVKVSGVLTATTLYGDGSNLTGVGESIAPWNYNPDINDQLATVDTGIGVTFNKKIEAGSGTATIKIVNAGVAGTTVQSWGISSATISITKLTLGSLVTNLSTKKTYQLDIPEGFVVDSNETSYVGTAWTFSIQDPVNKFFSWGNNESGELGQGSAVSPVDASSSPVQIPGDGVWKAGWENHNSTNTNHSGSAIKTDGTLWSWGYGGQGCLGQNVGPGSANANVSSPIQVGSDTTWANVSACNLARYATKTDGTAWAWGAAGKGQLGVNSRTQYSSPVQIGSGTDWSTINAGLEAAYAIKTNGTLWAWGNNGYGSIGQNNTTNYSSPVQIPGTTWTQVAPVHSDVAIALKTNGTLWALGSGGKGQLAQNNVVNYSSPVQIPGTTWACISPVDRGALATKTDGTLWSWGYNYVGYLGHNNTTNYSSPTQVPGTSWPTTGLSKLRGFNSSAAAIKTDGTLWQWGENEKGQLGQNSRVNYSSPVQMGALSDWDQLWCSMRNVFAIQADSTP